MEAVREVVGFLAGHLVVLLGLALGLSVEPRLLRRFPAGLVLRAVVLAVFAIPLYAFAVVTLMEVPPPAAGAILIFALAPGAPFLILAVRKTRSVVPRALWLTLVLSATACVLAPVGLAVLADLRPGAVALGPLQALRAIAPLVISLALGLGLHAAAPRVAARLRPAVTLALKAALLVVVPVLLFVGGETVLHADPRAIGAVIVTTLGSALLGHAAGRTPEERRLLGMSMVYGNPAIALAVARQLPDLPALPIVAAYIVLRALATLPYARWSVARTLQPVDRHQVG